MVICDIYPLVLYSHVRFYSTRLIFNQVEIKRLNYSVPLCRRIDAFAFTRTARRDQSHFPMFEANGNPRNLFGRILPDPVFLELEGNYPIDNEETYNREYKIIELHIDRKVKTIFREATRRLRSA